MVKLASLCFGQSLSNIFLFSLGPNLNLERSDSPPNMFLSVYEESNAKLEPKARVSCVIILGFWMANHKLANHKKDFIVR